MTPSHLPNRNLWISLGDPAGIGPEVTLKALEQNWSEWKNLGLWNIAGAPELLPAFQVFPEILLHSPGSSIPGGVLKEGYHAGWAIEYCVTNILRSDSTHRKNQALITGPIDKLRFNQGGFPYPGHTDFLSKLCGNIPVTMMMANDQMRVSLATVHVPLMKVAKTLTPSVLNQTLLHTFYSLKNYWKIEKPVIWVCGLNPHAGDQGLLGKEEQDWIESSIRVFSKKYGDEVDISGPFPADSLFWKARSSSREMGPDAIVALYHDQGLIPIKLLDFENTINITLGLPFVRTSVDHGTAFDIAGKGVANERSMEAAIRLALQLTTI